jgi:uncharacterized protein (TIGR03067 family)
MPATMAALVLFAFAIGGAPEDLKLLQGRWKVAAVFEDGQSMSDKEIATQLFPDGTILIDGPVISFLPAGSFEPKKLAFTIDARTEPKSIDLVGAARAGSKGIYLVAGDSLMVCLPGAVDKDRPRDFGAGKGTGHVLLVFKRATVSAPAASPRPESAKSEARLPAAPKGNADLRHSLIGTWGHQSDDAVYYYTLNADGTFSAITQWKKTLKRTFSDDVRTSGTWKLDNGVIIATVTASTEPTLRNQVFSWRVTSLGPTNLIAVDGQGRPRYEWRVR